MWWRILHRCNLVNVARHDNLSKTILQGALEGGRRRGRQRKCWMDNVRQWTSLPMPELLTRAFYRKHWKRVNLCWTVPHVLPPPRLPNRSKAVLNWTELNFRDKLSVNYQESLLAAALSKKKKKKKCGQRFTRKYLEMKRLKTCKQSQAWNVSHSCDWTNWNRSVCIVFLRGCNLPSTTLGPILLLLARTPHPRHHGLTFTR